MLNILGVSRFIDLSHWLGIEEESPIRFSLAIGVLAYPITFLCTDFISEIYGRKRANNVVWVGLILNVWIFFILWLGGSLNPPNELNNLGVLEATTEGGEVHIPYGFSFYQIRFYAFGGIIASMLSYLAAQFVDVHIFHFIKKKTNGKKLWLRNNASTLVKSVGGYCFCYPHHPLLCPCFTNAGGCAYLESVDGLYSKCLFVQSVLCTSGYHSILFWNKILEKVLKCNG